MTKAGVTWWIAWLKGKPMIQRDVKSPTAPILFRPMLNCFLAFRESFNRFPEFNYEVQGVFQERVDGRIKFHTYIVRE